MSGASTRKGNFDARKAREILARRQANHRCDQSFLQRAPRFDIVLMVEGEEYKKHGYHCPTCGARWLKIFVRRSGTLYINWEKQEVTPL
jgi:hypothetical protein